MYTIDVWSDFEELFRYNILLTCAGFDAADEQLYVVGCERVYNETITTKIVPTPPPPEGFETGEVLSLEAGEAERIHIILYVITNTLPARRQISDFPPFDIQVRVTKEGGVIYDTTHKVNQWGGESINIKL